MQKPLLCFRFIASSKNPAYRKCLLPVSQINRHGIPLVKSSIAENEALATQQRRQNHKLVCFVYAF